MSKIRLLLISTLCFLQALTLETQSVTETIALKGKLSSYHTELLHLPVDAKLTPLQPFGHLVEEGEPIYEVEYISSADSLLHNIHTYLQDSKTLEIEKQHMQAQEALMQIEAISKRSYHESRVKYEKLCFSHLEAKKQLNQLLKPYNISVDDLYSLPNHDIVTIEQFVTQHLPNQVLAPCTGILLPMTEGQNASVFKKMTHFGKIVDPESLQIELLVNEKQLSKLVVGQETNIYVPLLSQTFSGTIFNINLYPSSQSSQTQYPVTVRFTDLSSSDYKTLRLGMKTIVNVSLDEKTALLIPLSSVKSIGDKDMVMISEKNRVKALREVTLGATHGVYVEVISGLQPGEEILEHHPA